jgi:hypothetical protein
LALSISSNGWADLKTYDVDPQYRQEIYSALKQMLDPTGNPLVPSQGRVELLPTGQLLVNASPETIAQLDTVLQAIRTSAVAPTPRAQLRYWAVFGSRAPAAQPPGTAPPNILDDVLAELERLHGELMFRVIGTAALGNGARGCANGLCTGRCPQRENRDQSRRHARGSGTAVRNR